MSWGSAAEFFDMGGRAWFVWGSFLVTAAALTIEVIMLRLRRRNALLSVRRGKSARRTGPA